MPLPKSFTTVTPFSKVLAMVFFILFPVLAFLLGIYYEQTNKKMQTTAVERKTVSDTYSRRITDDLIEPIETIGGKPFISKYGFSIDIPSTWIAREYEYDNTYAVHFDNSSYGESPIGVFQLPTNISSIEYLAGLAPVTAIDGYSINYLGRVNLDGQNAEKWKYTDVPGMIDAYATIFTSNNKRFTLIVSAWKQGNNNPQNQIASTFKFLSQTPYPTCIPRPACLDATPRCLIPETENMCPPSARQSPPSTKPTGQTACTQEAKLCPDGSYVGRTGPNCEFAQCPQ